ncbi:dual specificity protein kinase yak1 [Rhodotorula kratochvilovae]
MPRPLSSYFTAALPSSSSSASSAPVHPASSPLLPSSHAPGDLAHAHVVPIALARPQSVDLEASDPSPAPHAAAPSRSLSLHRAASGTSRSYRQAGNLEQGLPLPLPLPLPLSLDSPNPSPSSSSPSYPLGHRQTRSVGRAPFLSSLGSPPAPAHPHPHQAQQPPPPPPLASRNRAPSLSLRSQQQQQQQQQQHAMLASDQGSPASRARPASSSRANMVYSPAGGSSAQTDPASPFGSLGSTGMLAHQQHYRGSPGGLDAAPMRRGISYDGAATSASSRPASLLPGSYTPSINSSQSFLVAGAGAGGGGSGRDLYSPMTGVQLSSTASSASGSTSANASSPRLMPMAPSPSRAYSPSHYVATHIAPGGVASGYASAPPHQQQQQQAHGGAPAPPAASFYPQHIAQSYPAPHSPANAPPLPPPSAPPVAGGSSAGPPPAHGLHHQPSLSSHHHHHQHHPHQQHAHGHSASYSPGGGGSFYTPLASAGASSTDLRNLSLSGGGGAPLPPTRRKKGLMRVREGEEIERGGTTTGAQPRGRRADPAGGFVSPLKALTVALPHTYHLVNPGFVYETSRNPRRVLTKPSKPASNEGFDNEDSDYILYVNDVLGPEDKDRYLILDVLGQGTFGQVVKCQNMKTHEIVAVKVVKNKPAYFQQSMMEVTILELVNNQWDKDDEHHMLRLKDTFIHHSHLCLVFELLSNNLYELIKQNSFRGLSTSLVRVFTAQLLDALSVLNEAKIIHCDLKPENILLKSLQSPTIKVIDFGSACHEKQTVYTYIQSRFYRSPEVILSLPYSSMIDMWSLGCICVELFLGLPLFPGTSEFNQITRIIEMLGMPPDNMLDKGKQTSHFFESHSDEYGRRRYRLKSLERYAQEYKANEQPSKKYFSASTLPEIIKQYPIVRKGLKEAEVDKEMLNRIAFIDFVQGLLHLDPEQRWTPQQARLHPFVLGEPLLAPFVPPPRHLVVKGGAPSPTEIAAAKQQQQQAAMARQHQHAQQQQQAHQPYGGLPPAPGQGQQRRTYDAKAYQQHLTQQQQAYAAAQAPRGSNNPYAAPFDAQQQHQQALARQAAQQPSLYGAAAGGFAPRSAPAVPGAAVANPPAAHQHYGGGRQRSGTDAPLPPALQKLGHELTAAGAMGAGQSITPVLRRDDQWQAWEQQYGAGAVAGGNALSRRISVSGRHPHLNLLQEQAEAGLHSWQSPARAKPAPSAAMYSPAQVGGSAGGYYASPLQPSSAQFSVVVDPAQGSSRPQSELFDAGGIAAPPLAYAAGNPSARYAPYPSASAGPSAGGAPMPPPGAAMPLASPLDASPAGFEVFRSAPPSAQPQPQGVMGGGHDPLSLYQPLQPYTSPSLGRGNGGAQAAGPGPPYAQQGQQQQHQGGKPRGLW